MKLPSSIPCHALRAQVRNTGFTVPEIMISMTIFLLVVLGVLTTHIFGLKMATVNQSKLVATQDAREALNNVRDDIRSGKIVYVGNGSANSFTRIPANSPQQGNSILIHQTLNTNRFIQYFVDFSDDTLKRRESGSEVAVIANFITNLIPFRAENYLGQVLTNDQNNRVIRMNLEFYQWEFPEEYDYYGLQTKVTRRAIE